MTVDWTKPIEAVHEDGTVQPATNMGGGYVSIGGSSSWWSTDSKGDIVSTRWKLRNVQPAAAKPAEIDAALVERMVALVRQLQSNYCMSVPSEVLSEAAAIVAELPEPVDSCVAIAKRIKDAAYQADKGSMELDWVTVAILEGICTGRQLEREAK